MNAMTYTIGQLHPPAIVRGIVTGPDTEPVWHCLIVAPQKERATREYFRARDIYAFYPSETRTRVIRGRRTETERPIITGHLYVKFRNAVNWDVMKARRLITGIYCRGNIPVEIPAPIIRHLQGLTVEAQRLEEARLEMLRVREGDRATIVSGPLAGLVVDVGQITGNEAWLTIPRWGKVKADIKGLERIVK